MSAFRDLGVVIWKQAHDACLINVGDKLTFGDDPLVWVVVDRTPDSYGLLPILARRAK